MPGRQKPAGGRLWLRNEDFVIQGLRSPWGEIRVVSWHQGPAGEQCNCPDMTCLKGGCHIRGCTLFLTNKVSFAVGLRLYGETQPK
jgi:hypothetical protein